MDYLPKVLESRPACELIELGTSVDSFFEIIMELVRKIEVFHDKKELIDQCDSSISTFLNYNYFLLEQQLFHEIVKVFDQDGFGKNENCSLKQIRKRVDSLTDVLPNTVKEQLIEELDNVLGTYDSLDMKSVRDKILMHHDWETLKKQQPTYRLFSELKAIAKEGQRVNRLMLKVLGIQFDGVNNHFDDIYEEGLEKIINCGNL